MLTGDAWGVYEMCILQVVVMSALARGEVMVGGMVRVEEEEARRGGKEAGAECGTGRQVCLLGSCVWGVYGWYGAGRGQTVYVVFRQAVILGIV